MFRPISSNSSEREAPVDDDDCVIIEPTPMGAAATSALVRSSGENIVDRFLNGTGGIFSDMLALPEHLLSKGGLVTQNVSSVLRVSGAATSWCGHSMHGLGRASAFVGEKARQIGESLTVTGDFLTSEGSRVPLNSVSGRQLTTMGKFFTEASGILEDVSSASHFVGSSLEVAGNVTTWAGNLMGGVGSAMSNAGESIKRARDLLTNDERPAKRIRMNEERETALIIRHVPLEESRRDMRLVAPAPAPASAPAPAPALDPPPAQAPAPVSARAHASALAGWVTEDYV